MPSKRVCQIIRIKPERLEEYIKIHANVWPGVLKALKLAHFTNYSIHHDPIHSILIANFTYVGEDWDKDMEIIANDSETIRWWKETDDMQESLIRNDGSAEETGKGKVNWWLDLVEVFRFEGDEQFESI